MSETKIVDYSEIENGRLFMWVDYSTWPDKPVSISFGGREDKKEDGSRRHKWIAEKMVVRSYAELERIDPLIRLSEDEASYLMDELWRAGFRPKYINEAILEALEKYSGREQSNNRQD